MSETEPPQASPEASSHSREALREGVTMALYVSLSLLAVMLATPDPTVTVRTELALTLFLTAFGLLVAHMLAFTVSSRLVTNGVLDAETRGVLGAQALGGLAVAVLAAAPLLLLSPSVSMEVSEVLLLVFVGVVGYLAAMQAQVSRLRALAYAGVVIGAALLVLLVKSLVDH